MTPEQIEAFQSEHFNHIGQRLKVDGDLGPQTAWALAAATLCAQRRMLLEVAQQHHGLCEDPPRSNDDPKGLIRGWCKRCGCKPGDPWCAAWASDCLSQVLGRSIAIGGALRLGRVFPVTLHPIAGDLFTYPTNDKGNGHTGFVTGTGKLQVMTLEGNCDNRIASWLRPRPGLTFHRTIDDVSGTPPGIVPSVPPAPAGTR